VARYVADLSKRAALLESTSRSVLRAESAYVDLEAELSSLAGRIGDADVDDPFLSHVLPDGGIVETGFEPAR
jgi:hypothetical protein